MLPYDLKNSVDNVLQKEISSSYWPTDGSLAKLAEQWNMTVLGHPITYTKFKKIWKSNNDSYKYIVEAVQNHISDNYLKVKFYSHSKSINDKSLITELCMFCNDSF